MNPSANWTKKLKGEPAAESWNPTVYRDNAERARQELGSLKPLSISPEQVVGSPVSKTIHMPIERSSRPLLSQDDFFSRHDELQERKRYLGDKTRSLISGIKAMRDHTSYSEYDPYAPLATGAATQLSESILPYTPVFGDAMQAGDAIVSAREGDYAGAAIGLGLLALPAGMAKASRGLVPKSSSITSHTLPGARKSINLKEASEINFLTKTEGLRITHPEVRNAYNDFKARISTPEGIRRAKALGVDPSEITSTSLRDRTLNNIEFVSDPRLGGHFNWYQNHVGIHPNADLKSFIARHEIEHGVQAAVARSRVGVSDYTGIGPGAYSKAFKGSKSLSEFRSKIKDAAAYHRSNNSGSFRTSIDDMLLDLDPIREPTPGIRRKFEEAMSAEHPVVLNPKIKEYMSDKQKAVDYFFHGSGGQERSAMLSELQQYMMEKGIIPSQSYVDVTPKMIKDLYMPAKLDEAGGGSYLRILNIMKPTDKNFELISKGLNAMLGIGGAVTVGSQILKDED